MNERITALHCFHAVMEGQALDEAFNEHLDPANPKLSYIKQMCFGAARFYWQLEGLIHQLLQKKLKAKDQDVYAILILASYELLYANAPDHAVVSQWVTCCKAIKKEWAKGLCNAVLRNLLREKDSLIAELDTAASVAYPRWLQQRLQHDWPDDWQDIANNSNAHPPMTLRVNLQQYARDEYLGKLHNADIEAHSLLAPESIEIQTPIPVKDLPGFSDGSSSVQDAGAQWAAKLIGAEAGDKILDACSAPGGKTCHLLELEPELNVIAADISEARQTKVNENLTRLKLKAEVVTKDLTQAGAFADNSFDKILLDAPCSATGVIRRHPDIKLLRQKSDISKLAQTQRKILTTLWPSLKVGGTLIYVTCSVVLQENLETIATFLQQEKSAEHQAIELPVGRALKYGWQILPGEGDMDGFYYAALVKL